MEIINNQELKCIIGGFNWSGTIVNALTGAGKFIYSVGQSLGSALRRIGSKNMCHC